MSKLEEPTIPNLFHVVTPNQWTIDGRRLTMHFVRAVCFAAPIRRLQIAALKAQLLTLNSSLITRRSPELSKQTYLDHVQNRYGIGSEGMLTDFLSRRDKRLLLADRIDLSAMVERYGAPLE